jgi:molecular chaperone GrpE
MADNTDIPENNDVSEETQGTELNSAKMKAELEKAKSDYLYLLADFDNYRKNAIKERSDLSKFGSERFVRDFLNVFDDFERALDANTTTENFKSFRSGVELIAKELKSLLQRFGVEELKAIGEPFDPSKHEALSSEPSNEIPVGHVVRVFKKAYKMHDKLIRPAQVTVSIEPPTVN